MTNKQEEKVHIIDLKDNTVIQTGICPSFMVNRQTSFPAGSICDASLYDINFRNAWIVQFEDKRAKVGIFSWQEEGKNEAYMEAVAYRERISNELDLTTHLHVSFTNEVPKHIQQFIAGFFDGDGSVGLYENGTQAYNTRLSFSQAGHTKKPPILEFIESIYGGSSQPCKSRGDNTRKEWKLRWCGLHCEPILRAVSQYGIIKKPQVDLLLTFVPELVPDKRVNPLITEVLPGLADKLKAMKILSAYQALPIDETKLSIPYIAGLFDAEGYVGMTGSKLKSRLRASITQNSSPTILQSLRKKFNIGTSSHKDWQIGSKKDIISFLEKISPYCIQKKPQIDAILKQKHNILTDNGTRNAKDKYLLVKLSDSLKRMKRL